MVINVKDGEELIIRESGSKGEVKRIEKRVGERQSWGKAISEQFKGVCVTLSQ